MTAVLAAGMTRSRLHAPTLSTLPDAVTENLRRVREAAAVPVMAVVKADAYGHGMVAVATAAVAAGAEWLGVTDVAEGVVLREAGLRVPILAWLHPAGIDAPLAAAAGVDVAVGSVEELRQLAADATASVRVHLHLDTGMARGGCPVEDWDALLRTARAARGRIEVVGVMGHLPHADSADPRANAAAVLRMRQGRDAVLRAGFGPLLVHLAATSGALTDPATHFDMVRVGAALVGIDPSETVSLVGASRFTAPVVHSAAVPAGTVVGYGGTHTTATATHLSVVGVGYADGVPREIASGAGVEIGGARHPIVGRVSMDQIVVDTGGGVPPGSGRDGVRAGRRRGAVGAGVGAVGGHHPAHHRHGHRPAGEEERGMTMKVLVIGGGQNPEHEVSLASAAAVAAALRLGGHTVTTVTIDRDGVWRADGIPPGVSPAASLQQALPLLAASDVVFPAVHGALGEDGALAALCALAGVPAVGSALGAGAIGMDKWATKLVAQAVGLRTARARLVAAEDIGDVEFEGAVVVKPVTAGSSHGVSLVTEEGDLLTALRGAARFDRRILVEEVVHAREIDVAVLREKGGVRWAAPPLEIHAPGLFDTATKYDGTARFTVPAQLDAAATTALKRAAIAMFDALGCDGVARMDFFLTDEGPVLNEVNTMPGLTAASQVPRMFAAAGVDYADLVDRLVRAAV